MTDNNVKLSPEQKVSLMHAAVAAAAQSFAKGSAIEIYREMVKAVEQD